MQRLLDFWKLLPPFIILLPYLFLSNRPSLINEIVASFLYFITLMVILLLYAPVVYPLFFLQLLKNKGPLVIILLSLSSVAATYIFAMHIMDFGCTSSSCFDGDPFSVAGGVMLFFIYNLFATFISSIIILLTNKK